MSEIEYFKDYKEIKFVRVQGRTKKATGKEWSVYENAMNYEEAVEYSKYSNYGVLCSKGLIVIDLDTPSYKENTTDENSKELPALNLKYKKRVEELLPKTLKVKTASGNHHYYFFCDDFTKMVLNKNEIINTELKEVHYGEIQAESQKGTGSQVIGPGSYYMSPENNYEIVERNQIAKIKKTQLFEVFAEFFSKSNETKEVLNFDEIDTLRVDSIFNTSSLQRKGNIFQGSHPIHGSSTGENFCIDTSKNSWYCFRCGGGGGPAKAIAVQEGIVSCNGNLYGENFKQVVKIAQEKYNLNPKKLEKFDNLKNQMIEVKEQSKLSFLSFKDFLNKEDKKTYYVNKMFGSGTINMIFSPPKQMKSFVSYYIAMCVAAGKPFLNQKCKKVPVIYFDWENPISDVQNRLQGIMKGMDFTFEDLENFYLFPKNPTLLRAERFDSFVYEHLRDELIEFIKEKEAKILFFDTLRRIGNFDENDSKAINTLKSDLFDPIINETNVCIIFLHHTSKEGQTYRGSVDIEGILDTSFVVKKKEEEDEIKLTMECVARRNNEIDKISSSVSIESSQIEDEDGDMYEIIDSVEFKRVEDIEEDEEANNYKAYRDFFIEYLEKDEEYKNKDLSGMLHTKFKLQSTTTINKILSWCSFLARPKVLIKQGSGKQVRYTINPELKDNFNKWDNVEVINCEDIDSGTESIEKILHSKFKEYDEVNLSTLINNSEKGFTGDFSEDKISLIIDDWNKKGWIEHKKKNKLVISKKYIEEVRGA